MMKSRYTRFSLAILLTMAGCSIKEPTECHYGQERCHDDSMGIGLYQMCSETGTWSNPLSCGVACDGNRCGNNDLIPVCDEEGKIQCFSNNEGTVVSLRCHHKIWLPEFCNAKQCSDGKGCIEDTKPPCSEGDSHCITVETLGTLHIVCTKQQWLSNYCKDENECLGTQEEPASEINTEDPNPEENSKTCEETCAPPNALDSVCDNDVCKATSCKDGYHLYQDQCEKDDVDHCGDHEVKCTLDSIPNSENVLDVKCSKDKECKIKTCAPGYHIYQDTCEANDMNNCGGHGLKCTAHQTYMADAECTQYGQCVARSCKPCAHYHEGNCENDTNEHCGGHDLTCDNTSHPGGVNYSCLKSYCQSTSCDDSHIKINDYYCLEKNCTENAEKCLDKCGTSTMYKCINNEWIAQDICPDNHSCLSDLSQCGECTNGSLRCSGTESQVCEQGTWKTRYDCNPQNGSGTCTGEGVCNTQCDEGYCLDNYRCVNNIDSNIYHCGGCGNNCMGLVEHAESVKCVDSECKATECEFKYHPYNGICEEDSVEHCGEHDNICNQYEKQNVCCSNYDHTARCNENCIVTEPVTKAIDCSRTNCDFD